MKVEEGERLPRYAYVLAMIALFALSIFALVAFMAFCYNLTSHFIHDIPTITFNRGGAFGLGGAIAGGVFGGAVFFVGVLERPVTERIQKILTYGLVIGIAIMLSLPIVSSIAIGVYADSKGYIACDEAEKKNIWPIYRTNYYTKDDATCIELVEEIKRDRPFL